MRPTVVENTAPSHRPHHTHTGHFRGTWREGRRAGEQEVEGKSIKEGGRVRLRNEEEIGKKRQLELALGEHSFTLKDKASGF